MVFNEIYIEPKLVSTDEIYGFFLSFLDTDRIRQDLRVIPTINAVYALAEGIHRTLQQKCGLNYSGVCAAFISDTDTLTHVMNNMDALSFEDVTQMVFRFMDREADRRLRFSRFLSDGTEYLVSTHLSQYLARNSNREMIF